MPGTMDLITLLIGGLATYDQSIKESRAYDETIRRFEEAKGLLGPLMRDLPGQVSDIGAEAVKRQEGILSGFQDRQKLLEGLGKQEEEDINLAFRNRESAGQQNLTSRGLAGTTILPSLRQGIERQRTDAQGRLQERLRGQRLDVNADILGARQQLSDLTTQSQLMPLAFRRDLTGDFVNLLASRSDIPPSQGLFAQLLQNLGQSAAPPPEPPSTDYLTPGIGAGATIGSAAILAGALAPATGGLSLGVKSMSFCIDGTARVITPTGIVPLSEIEVGDKVLAPDGAYRPVRDKDYGLPHPERYGNYVEIKTDLDSIVLTKDHVVGGKPAGAWRVGQSIKTPWGDAKILSIEKAPPVASGDLYLEGNADYVANGLPIGSMFTKYPRQWLQKICKNMAAVKV